MSPNANTSASSSPSMVVMTIEHEQTNAANAGANAAVTPALSVATLGSPHMPSSSKTCLSSSPTASATIIPLPPAPAKPLPVSSTLVLQPNAGLVASAERIHARKLSHQKQQQEVQQQQQQQQQQLGMLTTSPISSTSTSTSHHKRTPSVPTSPLSSSLPSAAAIAAAPSVVVVVVAPSTVAAGVGAAGVGAGAGAGLGPHNVVETTAIATTTIDYARAHRRLLFKEAVRTVIRGLRERAAEAEEEAQVNPTSCAVAAASAASADSAAAAASSSFFSMPPLKSISAAPVARASAAPDSLAFSQSSSNASTSSTLTTNATSTSSPALTASASAFAAETMKSRPPLKASRTPKLLASLEAAGAALSTSNVHALIGDPHAGDPNHHTASAASASGAGTFATPAGGVDSSRPRSALRSAFSFMKSAFGSALPTHHQSSSARSPVGHYAPRGPLADPNARFPVLLDDASNEAGMAGGAATSGLRFVFPPEHVKPTKRMEYERLCEELVSTERTYLQGLHVAIYSFMARLRAAIQLGKPILTESEMGTVFSNVEELYKANQAMFKELLELKHKGRLYTPELHTILANHASPFAKYSSYACDYYDGNKLLTSLREKREDVEFFFRLNELAEKSRLDDYLITPIQRIPRYILLLRSMRSCAEDGHNTASSIEKALAAMSNIAASINDDVHVRDAIKQVSEIEATLERVPFRLADGTRFHVMNGPLRKKYNNISFKRSHFCEMWFFLFSDLLVYTSMPDKKGFRTVRKVLPLLDAEVQDAPDSRLMYAFSVHCHSVKSVTLCAETEQEKVKWINRLQHQISATRLNAVSGEQGGAVAAVSANPRHQQQQVKGALAGVSAPPRDHSIRLSRQSRSSVRLVPGISSKAKDDVSAASGGGRSPAPIDEEKEEEEEDEQQEKETQMAPTSSGGGGGPTPTATA